MVLIVAKTNAKTKGPLVSFGHGRQYRFSKFVIVRVVTVMTVDTDSGL